MDKEQYTNHEEAVADLKSRVIDAINVPLNPSNFASYGDEGVNKLISVIDDTVNLYCNVSNITKPERTSKELEDTATNEIGLGDVEGLLDQLTNLQSYNQSIIENLKRVDRARATFLPPDVPNSIETGSGTGFELKRFYRAEVLVKLLLSNGYSEEDIQIQVSNVDNKMMRRMPYYAFNIPSLNRLVFVCNQQGNATFVFDTEGVGDAFYEKVASMTKSQLKEAFTDPSSGILGTMIRYNQNSWEEDMFEILTCSKDEFINNKYISDDESDQEDEQISVSESILKTYDGEIETDILWKRFATDEDGRHWSTIPHVAARLGLYRHNLEGIISVFELTPTIRTINVKNKEFDAYCYEEMAEIYNKLPKNSIDTKDPWYGFYTDESGKHFSSPTLIAKRLGYNAKRINEIIEQHGLSFLHGILRPGPADNRRNTDIRDLYAIEDLFPFLPSLNSEVVEWTYTYFGSPTTVNLTGTYIDGEFCVTADEAEKLNIPAKWTRVYGVDAKRGKLRKDTNKAGNLYSLNTLLSLPEVADFQSTYPSNSIGIATVNDSQYITAYKLGSILNEIAPVNTEWAHRIVNLTRYISDSIPMLYDEGSARKAVGYNMEDLIRLIMKRSWMTDQQLTNLRAYLSNPEQ